MNTEKSIKAWEACLNAGINMHRDFHELPSRDTARLAELAAKHGYRKPRNANGSTARYFHAYACKGRDALNE